jgi:hypothetical protein
LVTISTMVKGEVEKWSEKTDFHKDTYEIKEIERSAENVDNINIVSKPISFCRSSIKAY